MNQDVTAALVPKLRFPEFRGTEGWMPQSGDSLFNQINDRNPEPGLPVLAITQDHGAIPRHMIDYHVSVTEKSIESYKIVRVGDFIISLRSFQGGIEYSQYHGICSPAYVILRRRGKGSDEYFRHYLKTDRFIRILTKNLEGLRDGKMVSYAQFSELLLPTPKPDEQQKIAECLSSVDELMAAQARKVDALKTHKKGLMQQLFPREGETQPRLRFPEFQNAGEWEMKKLSAIAELTSSKRVHVSDYVSHGIPFFRGKEISLLKNNQTPEDVLFITEKHYESIRVNYGVPKIGDILITAVGTLGNVYCIQNSNKFYFKDGNLIWMKNISENSLFLEVLLNAKSKEILSSAIGSSQKALTMVELNKLKFAFPKKSEQKTIASLLSSLDALITAETQKFEALKTHKKGLMQQLFPSPEEVAG